jgi:hypothetical protein
MFAGGWRLEGCKEGRRRLFQCFDEAWRQEGRRNFLIRINGRREEGRRTGQTAWWPQCLSTHPMGSQARNVEEFHNTSTDGLLVHDGKRKGSVALVELGVGMVLLVTTDSLSPNIN